jgi:hypothetical protein
MPNVAAQRPGFRPERLARLAANATRRCSLDLSGLTVFTEAASGAYAVTPVLAALAGARRVLALARASAYGTVEQITEHVALVAEAARMAGRVEIVHAKRADIVAEADIITNSGHVRPIDAEMVSWMKPTAVVPLMYEAWEFRAADVDVAACRERGIALAGTNEQHPAIEVFSYLGLMAIRLLMDAGIAIRGSHIVVWCDNPFRPFLEEGLTRAGAVVESCESLESIPEFSEADAVLVAVRPGNQTAVGHAEAQIIAQHYPHAVVAQFWGDLDRSELAKQGVPFWPIESPGPGHQGILPSEVGAEPVVRLQAGGLKVGAVMARARRVGDAEEAMAAAVASGFAQYLP